jgi:phosphatidylglycerophosphatase A
MKRFILVLATGFGVGYSPIAPGTLGTLVAIPIYYFLSEIPSPLYEITLVGFFFLSVWISESAERYFGKKDDGRIVIDEIMGFLITMLWIPKTILFIIVGFFLFRFHYGLKSYCRPDPNLRFRWFGFRIVPVDNCPPEAIRSVTHLVLAL